MTGNVAADVQTIKTQTVTCGAGVTVLASVGTASTSTAQTGDAYARLGAPAGASVSADVAAVKASVGSPWQVGTKYACTLASTDVTGNVPSILGTIDGVAYLTAFQRVAAVIAGECSGAGSGTEVYVGMDKSTTHVTATIDGSGNRTAITYA